ncbi:MAG: ATP-binding protein [Hydrogenophaga sp.]|nr:ATP-binding protein [Hydrogenophaga sp.]MDZ4238071.1 ATP-binding protein [Hydrogenophaga sp.]
MPLDLLTLLAVRLGVDGLIAAAFFALMRRYPAIGGPGWWTLSALLSIVGSIGLWLRVDAHTLFSISVANTAICAGGAFAWLGVRSYLGLSRPLGWVVTGLMALLTANVWLFSVWDSVAARQMLFSLTVISVGVLAVRDVEHSDPQQRVPELQALKILVWVECTAMAVLGMVVVYVALNSQGRAPLTLIAPVFVFFFLLAKLLRAVLFTALVAYRLRRDGDQARQVLQIREADSRALVENLSAGVMLFRPDRTLSHANGAARRFLGWGEGGLNLAARDPMVSHGTLLAEDGQPMHRHELPFERVLSTGQPVRDVVLGVSVGGGGVRWALCNAHPENDAQGGLRHVVLTFVDISSLRAARHQQEALQNQLAQSQKMKALGTLAGGVAHDFNNILAAILGNADLARQDLALNAPARESLQEISTAARRGRELVRQILAFSRQQPMALQPVQVADVVAESCSLLRAAMAPQVELVQCCAQGVGPILADTTQLGQVLLNLGTNAVYALQGQPGRIEFRVEELPPRHQALPAELASRCAERGTGAVRIQVQDNGSGMSEETRSRIFDPFFTTKPVGSGTGLGLPVVLGIVQALGGFIEVQTAAGEGTTFSLFFPVLDNPSTVCSAEVLDLPFRTPAQPEIHTMADTQTTAPQHILYLDDDDALVFLVRRLLERRGYRVTGFTDQAQAIAAVRADPEGFDLLLTDYNMPGMSGLEVARAVLGICPTLPVAVASGYITDELQAQALAAGVREVVFKTDAVETFCQVVARLVK